MESVVVRGIMQMPKEQRELDKHIFKPKNDNLYSKIPQNKDFEKQKGTHEQLGLCQHCRHHCFILNTCSVQMTEPQRTQKNVYASNKTFRLSKQLLISGIAFLMRVQKPLLGIIKIEWLIVNVIVVESSARVLKQKVTFLGYF